MGISKKELEIRADQLKQGLKKCPRCNLLLQTSNFYPNPLATSGLQSICKNCERLRKGYNPQVRHTEIDSAKKCKLFTYIADFRLVYPCEYEFLYRNGLTDKHGSHLIKKRDFWTKEQCHEKALLYAHRGEFATSDDKKYYQYAKRHGWLDEICSHMTRPLVSGWTKSGFVKMCKSKNVLATLYLLKCWKANEKFYKIGITSREVESERYNGPVSMPYEYKVVWEIKGEPETIWKLESAIKKKTKLLKYSVSIPFDGSVNECFQCHGNCKLLQPPPKK